MFHPKQNEATRRKTRIIMNNRLLDLIKYKTGGRQNKFADLVGWTPQYLGKLLRGENFGLQPVLTLLQKLPEVNARWLLLGEGFMLNDDKVLVLRRETYSRAQSILMFDRFLSVMSPDEIRRFEDVLTGNSSLDFSAEEVSRWECLLAEKQNALFAKVNEAMSKSLKPCKHPRVRKS